MPTLLRYQRGGKFTLHADAEAQNEQTGERFRIVERDVSLLIYLNDDYIGGELQFSYWNYTYKSRAGDLVFFPSNRIYSHQSLPLKSGQKYSLASWAQGVNINRENIDPQRQILTPLR